ncbi:2-phosphosulfolactate phosphatase family protein [Clostridium hydrogeniformans]|uniref:2-phosphosulfolactate phosphatase family protein n=1 Tax=Clostridium hydrogeniformans TaxID=349933 RepID=UPI000480BF24|nr:2-phosphosulfolactate phosphatase family protein [Clostridium hydrogeniformans]
MKVDVVISAEHIRDKDIEGKTVVVIDILRATSVIVTALNNGAKEVIPFLTVEEAKEYTKENREEFILGGERRAVKIEGFDFSNSPLEYTEELVKGKTVVMTTTNGTRTIKSCEKGKHLLIGAMINAKAVVEKAKTLGEDVVFVNSGTYGEFSMDDFICAGYMISSLENIIDDIELSDIAYTSKHIYESHKDIKSFIEKARHYNVIKSLNLLGDLEYCMKKDTSDIVPMVKNGRIALS